MRGSRGGTGGPKPPGGKSQIIWVLIGNKDTCMHIDQEIPQSHNADQPTVTLERATEQSLDIWRTTK